MASRMTGLRDRLSDARGAAAVTAVASLFALTACFIAGGLVGIVMAVAMTALVLIGTRVIATPLDRSPLLRAALAVMITRMAATAILHLWLSQGSTSGAMFADDQGYPAHAARLAKWWLGEPVTDPNDPMDPVPELSYITFAAFLFTVTGPNVLVLKLANTGMSALAALLIYRAAANAGLPNAKWSAYLSWVFPSLVLWGSLTLKESFVLFLMGFAILCVSEQIRTRKVLWWIPWVITLLILYSSRSYLFVLLVLAWPVALAIGGVGVRRTALSLPVAAALLAGAPAATYFTPDILATPTRIRVAMAEGARSAIVTPPPAPTPTTTAGPAYIEVVLPPTPAPAPTTSAGPASVLPPAPTPTTTAGPASVDVVLPPPGKRQTVFIAPGQTGALRPAAPPPVAQLQEEQVRASLNHLPIGVLYLIGAPFPGTGTTMLDHATIPEMLLWYLAIALALRAILRARLATWRPHAYPMLVMFALAGVLSLVEGNVGTLVRHRGMLIPLVVTLSAVGLDGLRWRPTGSRPQPRAEG